MSVSVAEPEAGLQQPIGVTLENDFTFGQLFVASATREVEQSDLVLALLVRVQGNVWHLCDQFRDVLHLLAREREAEKGSRCGANRTK